MWTARRRRRGGAKPYGKAEFDLSWVEVCYLGKLRTCVAFIRDHLIWFKYVSTATTVTITHCHWGMCPTPQQLMPVAYDFVKLLKLQFGSVGLYWAWNSSYKGILILFLWLWPLSGPLPCSQYCNARFRSLFWSKTSSWKWRTLLCMCI